jgi:hypothetical protein
VRPLADICSSQVRGLRGVDAQWIMVKKDWEEAKRRRKEQERQQAKTPKSPKSPPSPVLTESDPEPEYTSDMDDMRCMLYMHGGMSSNCGLVHHIDPLCQGGYYFGSIDQERCASSCF